MGDDAPTRAVEERSGGTAPPTLGAQAMVMVLGLLGAAIASWTAVGAFRLEAAQEAYPADWISFAYLFGAVACTVLQLAVLGVAAGIRGVAARRGSRWSVWVLYWPTAMVGIALAATAYDQRGSGPLLLAASVGVAALLVVATAVAARVRMPRLAVILILAVLAVVLARTAIRYLAAL